MDRSTTLRDPVDISTSDQNMKEEEMNEIAATWNQLVLQTQLDWCIGTTLSFVLAVGSYYVCKRMWDLDWGDIDDPTLTGVSGLSLLIVFFGSVITFTIHLFLITNVITPEAATIRRLLGMLG